MEASLGFKRGFKVVSGLKVNFLKSRLIGINLSQQFLLATTKFISCRIEDKSFSFLRIPIQSEKGVMVETSCSKAKRYSSILEREISHPWR